MLDARDTVGTKVDKPEFELIRVRVRVGHSWQGEERVQRPRGSREHHAVEEHKEPCVVGAEKEKGPGWRVGEPW